ncbi:glycosyltransferase family 32 protein [Cyathus striatus]|nr:glycosyltransferase family 32 protein [Cyathus striatus]
MATSAYLPAPNRNGLLRSGLPVYSSSTAVKEKYALRGLHPWWTLISIRIPGLRTRRIRLWVPNPRRLHQHTTARLGRKRGSFVLCLLVLLLVFIVFAFTKRFATGEKQWPVPFTDPGTVVFTREDLQRIWKWEISSGHYPSRRKIPQQIRFKSPPINPALPPRRVPSPSEFTSPPESYVSNTKGVGPKRIYLDIQSQPPTNAYPPRPVPGSIADLDIVMEHCDFSHKKFVRDCLEVLRVGAGLDNGKRMRRGNMDNWKYIYVERTDNATHHEDFGSSTTYPYLNGITAQAVDPLDPNEGLAKRRGADWEQSPIRLPPASQYQPYTNLASPCDPENLRVFHMFWTGPFTDKPYLAILSFLFTQNTGLHLERFPSNTTCRPQFWLWINPGPAAAVPNPSAVKDMYDELKKNPWSSPFLHPRFKDVVQFKIWNTTEQLDGVEELRDEWRKMNIFNSGGSVFNIPGDNLKGPSEDIEDASNKEQEKGDKDDLINRTGSKSSSTYDKLSVILSDLARFILCHRFGGIYLDADTIFLRDWEELWGWKGAFAYRWSRLEKYNTAVLHLNKNSALGKFLFRTALKNNFDFHPMTVSKYTKEAHLEGLLLRLPDALFDSAWLNTENYQMSRPPQPFITDFAHFFDTPASDSAAPQALGFEGFYRGAFSYHFHNFWWKPFDPARDWPDLGRQFAAGEAQARAALKGDNTKLANTEATDEKVEDDKRDLDWATVLKRTLSLISEVKDPICMGNGCTGKTQQIVYLLMTITRK